MCACLSNVGYYLFNEIGANACEFLILYFNLDCLILLQVVIQLCGVAYLFLLTSKKETPDKLAISSAITGFFSLFIGELGCYLVLILLPFVPNFLLIFICFNSNGLFFSQCFVEGQRHSRTSFLKVYAIASSLSLLLLLVDVSQGNYTFEVRKADPFLNFVLK